MWPLLKGFHPISPQRFYKRCPHGRNKQQSQRQPAPGRAGWRCQGIRHSPRKRGLGKALPSACAKARPLSAKAVPLPQAGAAPEPGRASREGRLPRQITDSPGILEALVLTLATLAPTAAQAARLEPGSADADLTRRPPAAVSTGCLHPLFPRWALNSQTSGQAAF